MTLISTRGQLGKGYKEISTLLSLLRESGDSSQTNSSLEIWIINLRLGFWGWGFRILGLGQVLGTNSHGFIPTLSYLLKLDKHSKGLQKNMMTNF